MKSLIASLFAVAILGGCVAVPYYAAPAPRHHYYGPAHPGVSLHYYRYDHHRGPRHHR